MGSSKPWPDAMEVLTGQRKMDASALLDYFATLRTWLENENKRTGEMVGWETSSEGIKDSFSFYFVVLGNKILLDENKIIFKNCLPFCISACGIIIENFTPSSAAISRGISA